MAKMKVINIEQAGEDHTNGVFDLIIMTNNILSDTKLQAIKTLIESESPIPSPSVSGQIVEAKAKAWVDDNIFRHPANNHSDLELVLKYAFIAGHNSKGDVQEMVDNFPVTEELKNCIAQLVTAAMAQVGIDVSDDQQQDFQDNSAEGLIDEVLDTFLDYALQFLPSKEVKQKQDKWDNPLRIESLQFLDFTDGFTKVASNGWRKNEEADNRMARTYTDHELYKLFKSQPHE